MHQGYLTPCHWTIGFKCFIWFGDPLNYNWAVNYKGVPSANLLDERDSIQKLIFFFFFNFTLSCFRKITP